MSVSHRQLTYLGLAGLVVGFLLIAIASTLKLGEWAIWVGLAPLVVGLVSFAAGALLGAGRWLSRELQEGTPSPSPTGGLGTPAGHLDTAQEPAPPPRAPSALARAFLERYAGNFHSEYQAALTQALFESDDEFWSLINCWTEADDVLIDKAAIETPMLAYEIARYAGDHSDHSTSQYSISNPRVLKHIALDVLADPSRFPVASMQWQQFVYVLPFLAARLPPLVKRLAEDPANQPHLETARTLVAQFNQAKFDWDHYISRTQSSLDQKLLDPKLYARRDPAHPASIDLTSFASSFRKNHVANRDERIHVMPLAAPPYIFQTNYRSTIAFWRGQEARLNDCRYRLALTNAQRLPEWFDLVVVITERDMSERAKKQEEVRNLFKEGYILVSGGNTPNPRGGEEHILVKRPRIL